MKKPICMILCFAFSIGLMMSGCSGTLSPSGRDSTIDIKKVTNVNGSEFAFRMFKQLNKEDGDKSIFISPLSIGTALTMTYQGARTTTRNAMAKALEYTGMDDEKINESYKNLLRYLKSADNKVDLNISNSLWIREGEPVKDNFISINKDIFNASVMNISFSESDAAGRINKWISDATNKKIEKMIDPPIPPEIVMYLINAIYFKGDWTIQFDEKNTFTSQFHIGNGSSIQVKMMSRNGKAEYGQGDGFKAARLPYGSGKMAMYCILPDEGISINDFISGLDDKRWNAIKESISEREEVQIKLPRFKLEYGIKVLNDSLTALGMGEAFSDAADFSGIREGICISRVLHKAVIEVNEKGSEAAAATVVEMRKTAMAEPLTFIADRPFIFVIADDETGTILFMGKLYDVK